MRKRGRENNFLSVRKQVKQTASRYMRWIGLGEKEARGRERKEEKREKKKERMNEEKEGKRKQARMKRKKKDDHCHSSNIE